MVECFIFKYRFYSSGVVRPTDQEMTAIENKVHYSRFPRGGLQTTPCRATWGEAPMGGVRRQMEPAEGPEPSR